jgi:WhiB family redox-sensing transcriptional regulator
MSVHLTDNPTALDALAAGPATSGPATSVPATSNSAELEHVAPGRSRGLPCHAVDPDLWFAESPADVETAKDLCLPCPLRQPCLAGALERREPWGVWGGELVLAGVVVPRKRPRGRPRKTELAA